MLHLWRTQWTREEAKMAKVKTTHSKGRLEARTGALATEWMRTAIVYIHARWEQSERPEDKVSRYTVRPGT
jgi:hypothetical protein